MEEYVPNKHLPLIDDFGNLVPHFIKLACIVKRPKLAVIMGYNAMLSVSFNQDAPFEHVFLVYYYCKAPSLIAVDIVCMYNREDVVNLSSNTKKETPVLDDREKRGDKKDEHSLPVFLCAHGLAGAFG